MVDGKARPTAHVRIAADLAKMLGGILEVEGGSMAGILDPLIRSEIIRRHQAAKPALNKIRRARLQHAESASKAS